MNKRFPWIKYLVGIALFALWHQLHDIFPSTWAAILAEGEQESIFAHMKMLFYPYLILSVADYVLLRRKGSVPVSFVYARLLILVSAPWITMAIWYVPDALEILTCMMRQNLVEFLAHQQDLPGVDIDVRGLTLEAAQRLVDHDP